MNKKKWETPELLVIIRSQPEEAVLQVCKFQNGIINGPNNTNCRGNVEPPFCVQQLPS